MHKAVSPLTYIST